MDMLTKDQIRKIREDLASEDGALQLVFSVLGDSNRFRIVKLLSEHHELCVTDLANILQISMPAVSQHLRILELSDVVDKERMGQMICYMLKKGNPAVDAVLKLL